MNLRFLKIGMLSSILFIGSSYNAQVETPPPDFEEIRIVEDEVEDYEIDPIFDVVDQQPEFPGGNEALIKFLSDNIVYPKLAQDEGSSGKVYVQFVIWKDGSVKDVNVIRGVHQSLDNEAVRVIKMMPNWKPGIQRGKPVNTRFTLPIYFKIDAGHSSGDEIDNESQAKELLMDGHSIKDV